VLSVSRQFRLFLFALSLVAVGCHAQPPAPAGQPLSADQARRVEILIRAKTQVPPEYEIHVGPRQKGEVPGFDAIEVTFSANGKTSKPLAFLLSTDGNTLGQFNKFDISKDPKEIVSAANRPGRGGPANAPVTIVVFNDLECPFCARMHAQMFPAITARYGDQVHIVYRDYPLQEIHPWAMRAAIDSTCLAAQSPDGYWKLVDYIHLHAAELGGDDKSVAKANASLDLLTTDEGKRQKVDSAVLAACIAKQDDAIVKASIKEGEALNIDATPTLFINGEKLDGAQPMEYVYRMVDDALKAAGQTPPPPFVPPTTAAPTSSSTPTTTPGQKPGNQ
jgi:protein-disulfide isomerase